MITGPSLIWNTSLTEWRKGSEPWEGSLEIFIAPGEFLVDLFQSLFGVQPDASIDYLIAVVASFFTWLWLFQFVTAKLTQSAKERKSGGGSGNAHSIEKKMSTLACIVGAIVAIGIAPFVIEYLSGTARAIARGLAGQSDFPILVPTLTWGLLLGVVFVMYLATASWLQGVLMRRHVKKMTR